MKTEILKNGEPISSINNVTKFDEIVIGHGFVQCFRKGRCYATYSLIMFGEDSIRTISIKNEE